MVGGRAKARKDYNYQPTVSVILPCYNEGKAVYEAVGSLSQSNYPTDKFEIIAQDDCSVDDSYQWMLQAQRDFANVKVTVGRNTVNSGKARTSDSSASHASATLLGMEIDYQEGHHVNLQQLAALFDSVGWQARTVDRARLRQQVVGAMFVVSAWDGESLVGFARAISDGATNAYISTVAVLPAYQGQGIGRELIRRLTSGRAGIQFVLHARPAVQEFYLKCGFEHAEDMLRLPRKF